MISHRIRTTLLLLAIIFASPPAVVGAAASSVKLVMTSGSASERDGVIYVAQDLGLFRKHGDAQ